MMKIAFISYEYPPDTAYGGIAGYVRQAAAMMHSRGHQVEVFSGSPEREGVFVEDGVRVHRVCVSRSPDFGVKVAPVFCDRHAEVDFDVLEGPEYGADAREIARRAPDLPLVVKLHTPTAMVARLNSGRTGLITRLRCYLGAMRRGIRPPWYYNAGEDAECAHTLAADIIAAPSRAIGDAVADLWPVDRGRIRHVPYPYVPSEALLAIPTDTQTGTVTFLGRLEPRKGVLDLARAIPSVLAEYPHANFRFIGRPMASPVRGLDMRQYLERELAAYRGSVEFLEGVSLDRIPSVLRDTDICVFPSVWENFPLVCLESMAAARGIVGSSAGGMKEQLDDGKVGRLASPGKPSEIAQAIGSLLADPKARADLGRAARRRLLDEYGVHRIGTLQESCYQQAIAGKQAPS